MENREELDEMLMNEELNERIGFGRRLGAYLLDFLLVIVLGSIVGVATGETLSVLSFTRLLFVLTCLLFQI